MPQRQHDLALAERKDQAMDLFLKGHDATTVAARLNVSRATALRYKAQYDEHLEEIVAANPTLLSEVLANTLRVLEELDLVRRTAWQEYEQGRIGHPIECDSCGDVAGMIPAVPAAARNQFLQTVTRVQEQRARLYGLFGVKAEFLATVTSVKRLQEALIEFMRTELCEPDRAKLERFLSEGTVGEAFRHSTATQLPAIAAPE